MKPFYIHTFRMCFCKIHNTIGSLYGYWGNARKHDHSRSIFEFGCEICWYRKRTTNQKTATIYQSIWYNKSRIDIISSWWISLFTISRSMWTSVICKILFVIIEFSAKHGIYQSNCHTCPAVATAIPTSTTNSFRSHPALYFIHWDL